MSPSPASGPAVPAIKAASSSLSFGMSRDAVWSGRPPIAFDGDRVVHTWQLGKILSGSAKHGYYRVYAGRPPAPVITQDQPCYFFPRCCMRYLLCLSVLLLAAMPARAQELGTEGFADS